LFSDEKKWTVEEHFNSQNDRIYAASFSEAYSSDEYFVDAQQSPAYVMVWGAISTKSKVALAFLPSEKMTAKKYCDIVLRKHVMSLGTDFFAGKRWTFQQDGAPCHRAKLTQDWLERNVDSYIKASEWPPYSPDINPCDYYLWGAFRESSEHQTVHQYRKFEAGDSRRVECIGRRRGRRHVCAVRAKIAGMCRRWWQSIL
jgi:hypothetical protein